MEEIGTPEKAKKTTRKTRSAGQIIRRGEKVWLVRLYLGRGADGKEKYLDTASACPGCQTPPDELSWFYFESPRETWEMLCGCAGWMLVCDQCRRQTSYFEEVMS